MKKVWGIELGVWCMTLAMFLCGCTGKGKTDEPGVVEYMAGAEHIKTYKRTKSKIQDIDKSLKERYR